MSNDATSDLIKEQLFSKQKGPNVEKSLKALEKHGFEKKLKNFLNDPMTSNSDISDYLKSLSPSGIELEFMSLSVYELTPEQLSNPNKLVRKILSLILLLDLCNARLLPLISAV
jgi:hypothetical protein